MTYINKLKGSVLIVRPQTLNVHHSVGLFQLPTKAQIIYSIIIYVTL